MRLSEEVHAKLTILSVREWDSFQVIMRSLRRIGRRPRKKTGKSGDLAKKLVFAMLLMSVILPVSGPVSAKEPGGDDVAVMAEVVVTATRTETNLDRVGGSAVTVITAEEIAEKQPATVAEILKTVPGLDVRASGGSGTNTVIQLRGADNKNTLVLVDGIMYNDPSQANRGANIGSLTMENVERIEIVRGPMSVLYGSNATAGVVNIITRKGQGEPKVNADVEFGSDETWKISAGSSGSVGRFNFAIGAARTESAGFSIADDDNERIAHSGNTSEADGWENTTLSARLGFAVTSDFQIETTIRHIDAMVELDDYNYSTGALGDRFGGWPSYAPEPDGLKERRTESEQLLARVNFHNKFLNNRLSSDLAFQTARQDRDSFDNDGEPSYAYTGKNSEATWQGTVRMIDNNLITVGAGFVKEEMNSEAESIVDQSVESVSFWLQDQIMIGESLDIVVGLRNDDHDLFGSKTTYRVAPAFTLDSTGTIFKASYGTGFRAPSLYELYSAYGDENLEPEKSEGWDLGIEQSLLNNRLRIGVTYFALDFDDRIDYDFVLWKYAQQTGVTSSRGIETVVDFVAADNLDLRLTYTHTDTEDPNGERLARRPMNKASLNASYRFGDLGSLDCDLVWVGERDASPSAYDMDGNPVEILDSYTVVSLAGRYHLNKNVELHAKIENLFDEQYEEAWSYATPGLSGSLGVRVTY